MKEVVLKSSNKSMRPLMDMVFIMIGKVVLSIGALFTLFYFIGVLEQLASPFMDKLFDFTVNNIATTFIIMFTTMVVAGLFSTVYENKAKDIDHVISNKELKSLSERPIKLYNLKEKTHTVI